MEDWGIGKSILEILQIKNEFPVIFIGSGISKRYLLKCPSWEGLLEELWEKQVILIFLVILVKQKMS